MKIYNCIIIDNETLALNLNETHLAKIPNIKIIAKCHTAMEALSFINENTIDILFLDIEIPDITGIEGNLLIMGKTKKIPVSKTLKSTLLNLIDKNNIL